MDMNDNKWTVKLNGTKSPLCGNEVGTEMDDLDKIANELGTSKSDLLNNNIIKDIHIEQIRIRHGRCIDSIKFIYKITTNEKTYSIEGNRHGGGGGGENIINFEDDEYLLEIYGNYGQDIDQLSLRTYLTSKKSLKFYGNFAETNNTASFRLSPTAGAVFTCFYGKSSNYLFGIGMYEGKALSVKDIKDQQFQQLSSLLFPNQPYNFSTLKQEIIRLKYKELAPHVRNEKTKFEQLIADTKSKANNLTIESVIDLLLETHKQSIKNDDQLIKGELIAYQNVLQNSLTKEKLQTLLTKHTELNQLEEHLANLKIDE